jgi:hypothetical protein
MGDSDRTTYQEPLEGSIIDLRNEYFNPKARSNQASQHEGSAQGKWNLQKLSLQSLARREECDLLPRDRIRDFLLVFEIFPMRVYLGDAANAPAHCQVDFLVFPVFGEDDAPQRADDGVEGGEVAEKEPGR